MQAEVATTSSTDIEPIYAFDLDEDLLSHLAKPESWLFFQAEDFSSELIEDDFVAEVYEWQLHHARKHHVPAKPAVLEESFNLTLYEPQSAPGDLLERLRERFARNGQRKYLKEVVKLQHDDPIQVAAAMTKAGRELQYILTPKGETFGTGDADRAHHRYDLKAARGKGPSFGHPMLDEYFYGMVGLTFWIAPPKRYKSWQMIQGVVENASMGKTTFLYSLELPAEETDMRLRCMLADVPWWHYIRNIISQAEWDAINEASKLIDQSGIYKIIKPAEGDRSIDAMTFRAIDAGADAIFFDQLQYIEGTDSLSLGAHNKTGEYWKVLNRARDLSDQIPLCIAHQFNRDAMYADSMPPIEQAKGSSALEETATLALGMWANKDMMRSGVIEVGTLIARNHMYRSWEMDVQLSRGCTFEITRRKEEDEG